MKRKHNIRRRQKKGGYRKGGHRKNQKGGHRLLPNLGLILGMLTGGLNLLMNPENKNALMSGISNVYDKFQMNHKQS